VLVIPHPHYRNYNWYPDGVGFSTRRAEAFLKGLDSLILFETGFKWDLIKQAKSRGVKVVVVPMYEYSPYPFPVEPDLIACPSLLDLEIYSERYKDKCRFIQVPVDRPWKQRTKALEFIHNSGHGQHGFAKGTPDLIEAMNYVESPLKLIIRGQPGEKRIIELFRRHRENPKIEMVFDELPDEAMFDRGDVYINAEQFNGLSLPLQEARASGMLVITTDRFPANTWLPRIPLIPVDHYEKYKIAIEFDRAKVTPQAIAKRMDEFYGQDITEYSLSGKKWAEQNNWISLKDQWLGAVSK
jgi:hypothetical protein